MWVSQSSLERIRELEALLRDSVPREVYMASLARIADLERRVDWQADMLLRRAKSMPVPDVKEEPVAQPARQVSDSDIAKYEAIRDEAIRLGKSTKDEEVREWIQIETGWTEADIEAALHSN